LPRRIDGRRIGEAVEPVAILVLIVAEAQEGAQTVTHGRAPVPVVDPALQAALEQRPPVGHGAVGIAANQAEHGVLDDVEGIVAVADGELCNPQGPPFDTGEKPFKLGLSVQILPPSPELRSTPVDCMTDPSPSGARTPRSTWAAGAAVASPRTAVAFPFRVSRPVAAEFPAVLPLSLQAVVAALVPPIDPIIDAFATPVQAIVDAIATPIQPLLDPIPPAIQAPVDHVAAALQAVGGLFVAGLPRPLGPLIVPPLDDVAAVVEALFDAVAAGVEAFVDPIAALVQPLLDHVATIACLRSGIGVRRTLLGIQRQRRQQTAAHRTNR
jgi:hypothetical protein